MEVNFETLDFIVSQLDPDKVTFKIPVFDDNDLAFAKGFKSAYQPDVLFLSAGNPEPKATGNIVQDQLDRLKELWERSLLTIAGAMSASFLNSILSSTTTNVVFRIRKKKSCHNKKKWKTLAFWATKKPTTFLTINQKSSNLFDNRHVENDYFIKFNCPEFTSLCPITAQPDFATIYISYIPDKLCVESKSLKLYLFSYRNHRGFSRKLYQHHRERLGQLARPSLFRGLGKFTPRGGISIDPTTTTVDLELSMKDWQNNASFNTTFIQRKLTTVKQIRKKPCSSNWGARPFEFQLFFCSQESFFRNKAARTPPTIGARMKIHTCWRAAPPTKTAGAKLRAGLTESPVMFKPTRIKAVNDKPITKPAIAPLPLLADVTVMITRTNKKVAMTSNKKPPKTVTPFAKAFSPRLAVDMPELDKRKNTAADARKAPTTCPRM